MSLGQVCFFLPAICRRTSCAVLASIEIQIIQVRGLDLLINSTLISREPLEDRSMLRLPQMAHRILHKSSEMVEETSYGGMLTRCRLSTFDKPQPTTLQATRRPPTSLPASSQYRPPSENRPPETPSAQPFAEHEKGDRRRYDVHNDRLGATTLMREAPNS